MTIKMRQELNDPKHNPEGLKQLARNFAQLSMIGLPVSVVIYPFMTDFDSYPFEEAHHNVERIARNAGLPVLDLLPFFRGEDADALKVHPIDAHPNEVAQGIAAAAISEWLREFMPDYSNR